MLINGASASQPSGKRALGGRRSSVATLAVKSAISQAIKEKTPSSKIASNLVSKVKPSTAANPMAKVGPYPLTAPTVMPLTMRRWNIR